MTDDEIELIEQAKQGSQIAFKALYKKYAPSAKIVIRQFYSNKDIIDELLNTTFIKVFKKLNKFTTHDSFKSWVNTIANNSAIDRQRKEKRNQGVVYSADDDANFFQIESNLCNGEEDLLKQESLILLAKAISQLPKKQREVVRMFYIDDLSYKDISQKLAIPEGTIKSYLFRARAFIKNFLT